tara:strand:+ start:471 stop:617 length:147 start_codon:yes stop_codon:yes gene_type:complete
MEKIRYVCNDCGFRFGRFEKWKDPQCPNCGVEGRYEREDTVNKFLSDI